MAGEGHRNVTEQGHAYAPSAKQLLRSERRCTIPECGKSGRKLSYFGPSFGIEAIGGRRQAMTPKRSSCCRDSPNDIRNVVGEDQGERANPTEQAM